MAVDSLITIGAHTHSHPGLVSLSDAAIAVEMRIAAERFRQEMGFVPEDFAYPRSIWDTRVRDVIAPHCASATNDEISTPLNKNDALRIPRAPIRRSDGWRWFEPRVKGELIGEEQIIKFVRKVLSGRRGY